MKRKIHFISGLPRSGSTLLAAILGQNPRFYARMTGPLEQMYASLLRTMSVGTNESSVMLSETQRRRILLTLTETYYEDFQEPVIFDTSRGWTAALPYISELFPDARVIACVRNPAWIIDSIERYVRSHCFQPSKLFPIEPHMTVYNRVEMLMKPGGLVAGSTYALRQAWFSEHATRLIAVPYETLTSHPREVMNCLYKLLDEEPFEHDFEHVTYDEPGIDALIGAPGLHKVAPRVQAPERQTILPPDIFNSYNQCFWATPEGNPRGVTILQ